MKRVNNYAIMRLQSKLNAPFNNGVVHMRTLNNETLYKIEKYIKEYQIEKGKSPSYRNIMHFMNMSSLKRIGDLEETHIYLGKSENYDNETSGYDNTDDSLIYVSDRPQIPFLLYGRPYAQTQQELIDDGTFTVEDYAEYARLKDGVIKDILSKQPLIFGKRNGQNGVPFKYPIKR